MIKDKKGGGMMRFKYLKKKMSEKDIKEMLKLWSEHQNLKSPFFVEYYIKNNTVYCRVRDEFHEIISDNIVSDNELFKAYRLWKRHRRKEEELINSITNGDTKKREIISILRAKGFTLPEHKGGNLHFGNTHCGNCYISVNITDMTAFFIERNFSDCSVVRRKHIDINNILSASEEELYEMLKLFEEKKEVSNE